MAYSFASTRKIVMALCVLTIGAPLIPVHAAIKPAQTHDTVIQQFIDHFGGGDIKYENGKLMVYVGNGDVVARAGLIGEILLGATTIASCGASICYGIASANEFSRMNNNRAQGIMLFSVAVFFGGVGLASGLALVDVYKKLNEALEAKKVPYITFDSDGLAYMGRTCLRWSDIEYIKIVANDVSILSSLTHDTSDEKKILRSTPESAQCRAKRIELFDKNGKLLFWLPENDFNYPLSFMDFLVLVEHYISLYGKKQMDGASLPYA
jgi:hypothetical protein